MKRVSRKLTRVLAMILVLTFALSAMASAAWVEISNTLTAIVTVGEKPEYVAAFVDDKGDIIENEQFSTLQAAINAVTTEKTRIMLLKDVTLTEAVKIEGGRNIVLDLNEKTISSDMTGFEVINGSLELTGKGTISDSDKESANVGIAVLGHDSENSGKSSELTIDKNVTVAYAYGVAIFEENKEKAKNSYGVKVNIKGTVGIEEGIAGNAIHVDGDIQQTNGWPVINIEGATIKAKKTEEGVGVAANGNCKVTIKDATISGDTAVEVKAGEVTIEGTTTLQGSGNYGVPGSGGNGTSSQGYALAVVADKGYAGGKAYVNAGTIKNKMAVLSDNNADISNVALMIKKDFASNVLEYIENGLALEDAAGNEGNYYRVVPFGTDEEPVSLEWPEGSDDSGELHVTAVKGEQYPITFTAKPNGYAIVPNVRFVVKVTDGNNSAVTTGVTIAGATDAGEDGHWYLGDAVALGSSEICEEMEITITFDNDGTYILEVFAVQE